MDVRAASILGLSIIAAAVILSFAPRSLESRYQLVDVGDRAYRLDTQTGALEVCFPSGDVGECLPLPDPPPSGFRRVAREKP